MTQWYEMPGFALVSAIEIFSEAAGSPMIQVALFWRNCVQK
jgi:hypothetical protein